MRRTLSLLVLVVLALSACSGDDGDDPGAEPSTTAGSTSTVADTGSDADTSSDADVTDGPVSAIVFNGQGNDLVAYETEPPFRSQIVIPHNSDEDPDGLDINAQICFDPTDPRRFVAGEDTYQSATGSPGWGIFELSGSEVGELSAVEVSKLVPTYQTSSDNAENYGCGFLADGRIVTTDIGDQAEGDGNGQLIVWFGPFDARDVPYCKVDVTIPTAQGVWIDGDDLYVAAARRGILRYDIAALPTSPAPEDGCDGTDATGAPLATGAVGELFIDPAESGAIATPNAIVGTSEGTFFVSSVFDGVVAEFDADGTFVRDIVRPAADEQLGAQPYSVGTPVGLGVASDGTLYYADLGLVIDDGIGPGQRTGTVRRVTFTDGEPGAPEVMDEGLAFPDGIGIWEP